MQINLRRKLFVALFVLGGVFQVQAQSLAVHVVIPATSIINTHSNLSERTFNNPTVGIGFHISRKVNKLNLVTGVIFQKLSFTQNYLEDSILNLGSQEHYDFTLLSIPFLVQRSIYSAKKYTVRASIGLVYNYCENVSIATNSNNRKDNINVTSLLGKGFGWSTQIGVETEFFQIFKRLQLKGGLSTDIQLSRFYEFSPRIQGSGFRAPMDFPLARPVAYLALGVPFGR